MRNRRAQFFAREIKNIGVQRNDVEKEYENYVF